MYQYNTQNLPMIVSNTMMITDIGKQLKVHVNTEVVRDSCK